MGNSRIIDGGLVAVATAQVALADFPNLVWQDITAHPIQAMVGIVTIFFVISRTIRMWQKILRDRRKKHEGC